MKHLSLFLLACSVLWCTSDGYSHELPEGAVPLEKSATCAECHPDIYKEWRGSFHATSSAYKDPAHRAVHLAFLKAMADKGKKGNYHCANCHAPMSDNLKDLMAGEAELDRGNWTHTEGTGCTFCHRIESVIEKKNFNHYRLNKDGAFHTGRIANEKVPHNTAQSKLFSDGRVCMGCHSHKINAKGVAICIMKDEADGNCISCHMPAVAGGPAVDSPKTTHLSHKMSGGHDIEMLKKAVSIEAKIEDEGEQRVVVIDVTNNIKHTFPSTSPMRMAFIKVVAKDKDGKKIWENFKESPMEDKKALFFKAFKGGGKKGVPPWASDGVAFDTRLKAGETRALNYPVANPAIKEVTVELFYLLFPPKAIDGFAIPRDGVNEKKYSVAKKTITL